MIERFSKTNVALHIYRTYIALQNQHYFSNDTGYSQVEGKKTNTIVNYGRWCECFNLMNNMDLWKLIPEDEPNYKGPIHRGKMTRD